MAKKKAADAASVGQTAADVKTEKTESVADTNKTDGAAQVNTAAPADAGDNIAAEIEKLTGELGELKDQHLRLAAEYDNYRKRTAKEREQFYSLAKAAAVEALLPVYDNLALAVAQKTPDENYKQGVLMIARQFDEAFAKLGVTEIPAARGDEFDPELHNAVMHTEDTELAENRIAAVFQKGFALEGKVIRHAVVQVAN